MNSFTDWMMGRNQLSLSSTQRATHTYVIGQSGTGKSRALESWIMQDIKAGKGVGVIDPHGELFDNLLARIAIQPKLWEKVIIFDPTDPKWVVGFNPLEKIDGITSERLAMYMTDVVIRVWKIVPSNSPRMVWLLTNTFLALVALNLSLLEMRKFLVDEDYRNHLIRRVSIPAVQKYFLYEFPTSKAEVQNWISPILNKVSSLIFDPDIRQIFGGKSTINFRKIMDDEMILLVNTSKGILGEGMSALLGAFIVAHIQKTALSRANSHHRPPFYLYLDEFQNYTTDNIIDILSESRKYALSLTLAHQYSDQLPGKLRSAILNTSGTMVSFRVGYQDANRLAREIFPSPDFIQRIDQRIRLGGNGLFGLPFIKDIGWDGLALELSNLEQRQFWMRKRGSTDPVKQKSFNMATPTFNHTLMEKIQQLRDFSGNRFARRKIHTKNNFRQPPAQGNSHIPWWTN